MKEEKGFRLNFDNDDDDSHLDKLHSYVDDDAGDHLLIFSANLGGSTGLPEHGWD